LNLFVQLPSKPTHFLDIGSNFVSLYQCEESNPEVYPNISDTPAQQEHLIFNQ